MGKSFRNFDKKSSDDAYLEKRQNQNHADHIKEKKYLNALKTQDVESILEMEDDLADEIDIKDVWEAPEFETDDEWAADQEAWQQIARSVREDDNALLQS